MDELGFFRRQGSEILGQIGVMRAAWDREHGGTLRLQSTLTKRSLLVSVSSVVTVFAKGQKLRLLQQRDKDPRLIICEQGPVRIALRTMYSLIDEEGTYHGDGLTDAMIYGDGEVQLAFGLRLVDSTVHDAVAEAGIRFQTDGRLLRRATVMTSARSPRAIRHDVGDLRVPFRKFSAKRLFVLGGHGEGLALAWYSGDGCAQDKLGGVGMWHGPRPRPPFYDMWGHLYDQWQGLSGWEAHRSGCLEFSLDEEGKADLSFWWLRDTAEPCGELFGMRALVGLFFERSCSQARSRAIAYLTPLTPSVIGAEFRCLDLVEDSLLYRKTGETVRLVFPRDRFVRRVRVRVFGVSGNGKVLACSQGRRVPVQLLAEGGLTDDPYGPNHARPDSRFMPLVGAPSKGPYHAVFSFELSARRKTVVELKESDGLGLFYIKWDDRQIYVLKSGKADDGPLGFFSPLAMALHNLRRIGATEPALVRIPLFWYPTNVQTRGECFNEPRRIGLSDAGLDGIELWLESSDPNERAKSTIRVRLGVSCQATALRVTTTLRVQKPLDLNAIQYLNAFPCNSWRTEDWCGEWVLAVSRNGGRMLKWYKEPRNSQEQWKHFQYWKKRLVLVYGSSPHGNLAIVAEARRPARQTHGYVLCPVWLDSHLTVEKLAMPVPPGTTLAAAYSIVIFGHQGLSVDEAQRLAKRMLQEGVGTIESFVQKGQ